VDISALAREVTLRLIPLLPYLLKRGNKAAEETAKTVAGETWDQLKDIWAKLGPKIEAKPSALEAVHDAVEFPEDEDIQAVLRMQVKKLLSQDEDLAQALARLLDNMHASGHVVTSGNRSVAIGGSITGSSIITGDANIINDFGKSGSN